MRIDADASELDDSPGRSQAPAAERDRARPPESDGADGTPAGQDDQLIGAERLPRKGDEDLDD
jgi:hypothetical protein